MAQHYPPTPPPYKPLKPTLTANERPAQSVSNPVPIWSRLPGASSAFVPWLQCEGRGLHAAPAQPHAALAQLQAFIKYAPLGCCEEKDPNQLISSQAGDPPHMQIYICSPSKKEILQDYPAHRPQTFTPTHTQP